MESIPIKLIQYHPIDLDQDKLIKIKDSINEQGLLHPITVHKSNGSFELLAGRYRLEAVKLIYPDWQDQDREIFVEVKENLDEIQKEEVSLHENLKREQLPWHEEVLLVQKLHDLRQKQHGLPEAHRPKDNKKKGWSVRDTANELGKALGGVSEDLQLARMVQQNNSLKNIKDKATAMKVVKQTAKRIFAEEEQYVSGDVPFANEIFLGDASSILEQLPPNSFDFCITDPPWVKYRDENLVKDEQTVPVFKALYRVMKVDSFMWMFCGEDDFHFYKEELPRIGWKVQGHPCIWQKINCLSRTGMSPWQTGRDLELILLAVKGSPVIASSSQVSSIFSHAVVPSRLLIHPNEKSLELIKSLLRLCSYEGSLGIDPFAGSGVLAEACKTLKRRYVLVERDPTFYHKILKRLGKEKK